jgi:hypothetical protein
MALQQTALFNCMFCSKPLCDGEYVTDDNEGIACLPCADEEIATQKAEQMRNDFWFLHPLWGALWAMVAIAVVLLIWGKK